MKNLESVAFEADVAMMNNLKRRLRQYKSSLKKMRLTNRTPLTQA